MMKKQKKLVCFTAAFPYGLKETFFENELPYLSDEFEKVIIIPVLNPSKHTQTRMVPDNVVFVTPTVSRSKVKRTIFGLFNSAPILLYLEDFFRGKVYTSPSRLKHWFNSLLLFRSSYCRFKKIINKYGLSNEDTVLYSYWGEAPLFITDLVKRYFKIIRMHRIDFYEEVNDGYLPLRKRIYTSSQLLLPISDDIKSRLINSYKVEEQKIFLARLGVDNPNNLVDTYKRPDEMNTIRLVSCSRVDPVKRVQMIWESIKGYSGPKTIEWHHFGDGMLFNDLKGKIGEYGENKEIKVFLHGWATQEKLFDFYRSHYVDWFINVSESEGIPVSIMEAMSFSVPVIATNVGATSEIVNNQNGYLIDVHFKTDEILRLITDSLDKESVFNRRSKAFETWSTKYRATNNYKDLVSCIRKSIS